MNNKQKESSIKSTYETEKVKVRINSNFNPDGDLFSKLLSIVSLIIKEQSA